MASFEGNPHIGLYARASGNLTLLPVGSHSTFIRDFDGMGRTELVTIAASNLVGIFCAMNSNGIVVPTFCEEDEKARFRKLGLNVCMLPSMFAAVGNNVCANDKAALVNPDIPRDKVKMLADCLGVEVHSGTIANHKTVGSACVATDKGFVAHNRASEEDMAMLKEIFKVGGLNASVNMGSPFVGLGIVASSKGCVIGEATSGFEASRISEALDI